MNTYIDAYSKSEYKLFNKVLSIINYLKKSNRVTLRFKSRLEENRDGLKYL